MGNISTYQFFFPRCHLAFSQKWVRVVDNIALKYCIPSNYHWMATSRADIWWIDGLKYHHSTHHLFSTHHTSWHTWQEIQAITDYKAAPPLHDNNPLTLQQTEQIVQTSWHKCFGTSSTTCWSRLLFHHVSSLQPSFQCPKNPPSHALMTT